MTVPVEAAIEKAMLQKATDFAATQSLSISMPNGVGADGKPFQAPQPDKTARWLRASVIPAPTITTGIPDKSFNQHYGFMQIDVLQGLGGGTTQMKLIAGAIAAYFPMGMPLSQDGFTITIRSIAQKRVVSQAPLMNDGPSWVKIPVTIPYLCFARPA
jgi:hypothetical protein